MKKRATSQRPALRTLDLAVQPFFRLWLYALGAFGTGFVLSAAQFDGKNLPAAISLAAALPFSLAAVCAYAGAACGYLVFWGMSGAAEPVAAGFLILAASCLFHDVIPASRRWFLPLCAAGIHAAVGLIFLLSAPVTTARVLLFLARATLVCLCARLFSGLPEKSAVSLGALGLWLLLAADQLVLLPGLTLGVILAGCISFLFSASELFLPAAGLCGLVLEIGAATDYCAMAMLFLAASVCHAARPRFVVLRASLFFLTLAASAFLFGAGRSLFPFGVFWGTVLGIALWKPAQALITKISVPADERRLQALRAASGAFWSLASSLQRGTSNALAPQSAVIFDKAAEEVCRTCAKWSVCWEQNAQETFRLLSRASRGILRRGEARRDDLPPLFLARCCHTDSFLRAVNDALCEQLARVQYLSRLAESRQILCDQYRTLSRLLSSLSEPATEKSPPDTYAPELGFRAKGLRGADICGDYGASFRCGEWFYVLLCDGMGAGESAKAEAVCASSLLKELIEAGFDAQDAMQSLNALYILRDTGAFAAIDLLQISLASGEGFLHKWGAAPSFLKFGRTIQRLGAPLPPPGLGVGQGYRPECIRVSMQRGEALVLTSDGVDAAIAERYLQGCGELCVRELAAGVVASCEDAPPDDRTAAVLRLRLCASASPAYPRILSQLHLL